MSTEFQAMVLSSISDGLIFKLLHTRKELPGNSM